jgi:SNF2 family DNA or RNA helicase
MLKTYDWAISYSSQHQNPLLDFYIPALVRSRQYDRKSGFFNSAILCRVASGLGAMLENGGKMRLIMGCQFSPQDLTAIREGYALREALTPALDAALTPPQTFAQLKQLEILSWLIQHDYLDIKIAIPLKSSGEPEDESKQLDPGHIFHEKVGIFTDAAGDQLVFNGSNNESVSGWEQNTESFHTFCSWEGDRELQRVNEEVYRFEELWNGLAPNVRAFEIPAAVQQKLLRYLPSDRPTWKPEQEFDTRPISPPEPENREQDANNSEQDARTPGGKNNGVGASRSLRIQNENISEQDANNSEQDARTPEPENNGVGASRSLRIQNENISEQDANNSEQDARTPAPLLTSEDRALIQTLRDLPDHAGCLAYCLDSIPIQPWPHQVKILRRVAAQFPCNVLIADEVGLGKTIETGLILRYLLVSQRIKRVLVLAPASVQPQWQGELREKFNLHFWSYSQGSFRDPFGEILNTKPWQKEINSEQDARTTGNPWNACDLVLASSHLVRRQDRMAELLEAEPWDLVVLDEAHHARRKSPQQRKETPNSLLKLMQQLRARSRSLILLSATPMQIDPIEVFDLLDLLGLHGHWRYGDNFCQYFETLADKPDFRTVEFWQQMSVDYFRHGQPCDRLNAYLRQADRMLAYRLEDTWQRGKAIVDGKAIAKDTEFIAASRQFLTVNTPLKDLMFRHTRDTLRQYFQRGLLSRDIPQRLVQDNAINLEPEREIPLYRAVSDYVRDFYRLAQKQDRKALGFLMTLYRKRLTSSFYAIQQSLQRRLKGISLTDDDLNDLDEADDAIITGLESYLKEPVDPKEIEYLEDLLHQFENTGEDSKLAFLIQTLRQEFLERESALVFTQYTDTMDYLRETLRETFGDRIAGYSGRGGELPQGDEWRTVPKEQIKRQFRAGDLQILLCTESASEGLNLQTCGILINYDLPWNPMRVEQRIGRLDRIGQRYPTVKIHNFYYDGTVEAKVYKRLRERIDLFSNVVGNLQPILAQVPTFIEKAVMSADPQEEDVLMAAFEQGFDLAPLRPSLDEMIERDVEADIQEVNQPLVPSPITWKQVETLFTQSEQVRQQGFTFTELGHSIWQLARSGQPTERVTFNPAVFDDHPSLRLLAYGDPLFEQLIALLN